MSRVFSIMFNSGTFPTGWTECIVIPPHKKGDANNTNNYRDSSTCVSSQVRLFAAVLHNRLSKWPDKHDIIADVSLVFDKATVHVLLFSLFTLLL